MRTKKEADRFPIAWAACHSAKVQFSLLLLVMAFVLPRKSLRLQAQLRSMALLVGEPSVSRAKYLTRPAKSTRYSHGSAKVGKRANPSPAQPQPQRNVGPLRTLSRAAQGRGRVH